MAEFYELTLGDAPQDVAEATGLALVPSVMISEHATLLSIAEGRKPGPAGGPR